MSTQITFVLTIMSFNQATALDLRVAFRPPHLARRLLGIGFPLTVAFGTLAAHLLLPALPLFEAVCLAVIVAPTEVALIEALVQDRRIPERIRHALSVESGFYDGLALAVLLLALAMASAQTDHLAGRWVGFVVRTEGLSTIAGVGIGALGAAVVAVIVSLLVHGLTLPAGLRLYPAPSADAKRKVL